MNKEGGRAEVARSGVGEQSEHLESESQWFFLKVTGSIGFEVSDFIGPA